MTPSLGALAANQVGEQTQDPDYINYLRRKRFQDIVSEAPTVDVGTPQQAKPVQSMIQPQMPAPQSLAPAPTQAPAQAPQDLAKLPQAVNPFPQRTEEEMFTPPNIAQKAAPGQESVNPESYYRQGVLASMPLRTDPKYEPSGAKKFWSRLAGVGTGVLSMNPAAGILMNRALQEMPYRQDMRDWQQKVAQAKAIDELAGARSTAEQEASKNVASIEELQARTGAEQERQRLYQHQANAPYRDYMGELIQKGLNTQMGKEPEWFDLTGPNGEKVQAFYDLATRKLVQPDNQNVNGGKPIPIPWTPANMVHMGKAGDPTKQGGENIFQMLNKTWIAENPKDPYAQRGLVPPNIALQHQQLAAEYHVSDATRALIDARIKSQQAITAEKTGGIPLGGAGVPARPPLPTPGMSATTPPAKPAMIVKATSAIGEPRAVVTEPPKVLNGPAPVKKIIPGRVPAPPPPPVTTNLNPLAITPGKNAAADMIEDKVDQVEANPDLYKDKKFIPSARRNEFDTRFHARTGLTAPNEAIENQVKINEHAAVQSEKNVTSIRDFLKKHPALYGYMDPIVGRYADWTQRIVGTDPIPGIPKDLQVYARQLGNMINMMTTSEAVSSGRGRIGKYLIDYVKQYAPKLRDNPYYFEGALRGIESFAHDAKETAMQARFGDSWTPSARERLPIGLRHLGRQLAQASTKVSEGNYEDTTVWKYVQDKKTGRTATWVDGEGYKWDK